MNIYYFYNQVKTISKYYLKRVVEYVCANGSLFAFLDSLPALLFPGQANFHGLHH